MNYPKRHIDFRFHVIVLGIVVIISALCTELEKGPNVCEETVGDQRYNFCCFNYYVIDGHCHECENGTIGNDGWKCRPCNHNFYGHKCKYECFCESGQRCDKLSGCVDQPTTFSKIEMSTFYQSHTDSKLKNTSEANPKLTTIPKEKSDASTGIQVLCYMIVAAGLITWMIVCLKCSTYLPHVLGPQRSRQSTRHVRIPTCQMQEVRNNFKINS